MINCDQFRAAVIKPSLEAINLYSRDVEELLIATMAQESKGGTYLRQVKGPAVGPFQMEPRTYNDLWDRYMSKGNGHVIALQIMKACNFMEAPEADEMTYNLKFATMMARVFYLQFTDAIPKFDDVKGIWSLYKKRWNTELGAAKEFDFMKNYTEYTGKK